MALRARANAALALPGAVLFALCFALPGLAILANALVDGGTAFGRVLDTAGFARALGGSAALTLVAAGLSTSVGVAVALHLSQLSEKRRTLPNSAATSSEGWPPSRSPASTKKGRGAINMASSA